VNAVVAVYEDLEQAERALDELRRFDYPEDQLGLAVVGGETPPGPPPEPASEASPVAVGGAVLGGLVGALAAGTLPGLGPVLAGGLLGGVLEGAAAGGLLGLLLGLGVPEPQGRAAVAALELGRAIVVVRAAGERLEEARDCLEAYGPYELAVRDEGQGTGDR